MSKECNTCEGSWCGKGHCSECGMYDCCYYRFCPNGDSDSQKEKEAIYRDFIRDMDGNNNLKLI